ncbi:hypothetical protein RHGRI_033977 [Rhododendron griersonianum]|uniref:Uncharacterized protein n=1 Tax=Rhododendron griersonianum TaxID=479676 RepID=A0AAV6I238_9ERIC|nr:hypothetical protein RHGRI_033977 [Rhododendron griersonianum]
MGRRLPLEPILRYNKMNSVSVFRLMFESVLEESLLKLQRSHWVISRLRSENLVSVLYYVAGMLMQKFILPLRMQKAEDQSSEVVDKLLQLMLCILDGLHLADNVSVISIISVQWAPIFNLLTFIQQLLLKDPRIVHAFRCNITSCDLVDEEVSKFLRLAARYRSSSQILSAVADFLDLMNGSTIQEETNSVGLHPELKVEKAVESLGLVERFHLFLSPASDNNPCATVLSLLIRSLQKVLAVIESHSWQLVPSFLKFMGYNVVDRVCVRTFNAQAFKGREWKNILKEWLKLLKSL